MDLDQDIKVINPKDTNVGPEERPKWRMPELPPIPKDLKKFQQAPIGIYQSQYKNWHNELLSSSEEVHGPKEDRRTSEGLDTHVMKGKGPTDKSLVEKPKHVVRGPEEEVGPRKGQQPSGSSPSLHRKKSASKSAKKGQESPKEKS
ncbi:hypothetical protein O181_085793 [Austropuccinia psidii MF-1]|uniref:Uncharacterized protein n=1 Tax=Austropuccinia psidii MF-1 TaxID=1389203 RepID=A0A9Q3FTU4_9BASI|nr:hypothetical protein [Austropuccinia psidii MF-1]